MIVNSRASYPSGDSVSIVSLIVHIPRRAAKHDRRLSVCPGPCPVSAALCRCHQRKQKRLHLLERRTAHLHERSALGTHDGTRGVEHDQAVAAQLPPLDPVIGDGHRALAQLAVRDVGLGETRAIEHSSVFGVTVCEVYLVASYAQKIVRIFIRIAFVLGLATVSYS